MPIFLEKTGIKFSQCLCEKQGIGAVNEVIFSSLRTHSVDIIIVSCVVKKVFIPH